MTYTAPHPEMLDALVDQIPKHLGELDFALSQARTQIADMQNLMNSINHLRLLQVREDLYKEFPETKPKDQT